MPFHVGNGCFPAEISNSHITPMTRSDTPPEISVWEKIKAFFCSENQPEALELIRLICHPPAGTTREVVAERFEKLRTLAYGGVKENVQSGRHGENHFCILDENSQEMLSVTLDEAGKYTVKCQGHDKTHNLNPATAGEDCVEHTAAATAPQTAEDYELVWSEWESAAPTGEGTERARVVQLLRENQNSKSVSINLVNLNISSLPDHLPSHIRCIEIKDVPLHSLPTLPDKTEWLFIENTSLTSLPMLPAGVTALGVSGSPLNSLPALPDGLENIDITGTSLTELLAFPGGLRCIAITGTLLTELPELPEGLDRLSIRIPSLTSLPALPASLMVMVVRNTSITSLPESFTGLSRGAFVDISDNPLSERTRQALEAMTSDPGYSGPRIEFNMAIPSAPREARPLHLAVADWLAPTQEGEPAPEDKWQSFGQENDSGSFSAFLDRLSETENFTKDADFKAQTGFWLTQLAEDDELRAKTFAMATEATSSCEDRVTLALNQMKNVQLVHDAEKGKYDNNPAGLVSAGREMFRLEKLEQIARDKVSTLRFVDEIEVYLGYQNKLKEPLELSRVTKEMRFFGVSHITESDLQAAELQVKTGENEDFREWILQWAPLRSVLERAYPEDWETLNEKKISDYDNAYRTLLETKLKPAGLTCNADAEREIGARALDSAEKAFLDGLGPLANKMLGGHLKARWP